jgi:hypothetical protein
MTGKIIVTTDDSVPIHLTNLSIFTIDTGNRLYFGTTERGIEKELESLERTLNICRQKSLVPLATTAKLGIVIMAEQTLGGNSVAANLPNIHNSLSEQERCKAILPFLTNLLEEDQGTESDPEPTPDNWQSTLTLNVIDALNKDDFSCVSCHQELWNYYYQCKGCCNLLQTEFNLCWDCYNNKKYLGFHDPGERLLVNRTTWTNIAHFGRKPPKPNSRNCVCSKTQPPPTPVCSICDKCVAHKCHCHSEFVQHYRFYTPQDLDEIYTNCAMLSISAPIT